jgi:D-3-phosphoglycerate dehydrogenase / 2-oxoglutarate reductase
MSFKQALLDHGYELLYNNANAQLSTGIITSNKLLLNKNTLQQFPNLKWIARLGSGMEIIDTRYCDEQGIRYASSPEGISNSVAEHVIGMLLGLLHHIHSSQLQIQAGQWIREANRGIELAERTVGIIGYGHTGRALAKKLRAFTTNILVYDKYKTGFVDDVIKEVSLEQLQQQADVVSFHVPLNDETRMYYDAAFYSAMSKPHILINSARGGVADTNVILSGLKLGQITGACLDVLEEEKSIDETLKQPDNIVHELLKYNVILTPHIAGYSYDAIEKMSAELLAQLRDIL